MRRFQQKIVVITGASKGIGRETAHLFAAEGATVVLAARNQADLSTVESSIVTAGGQALSIVTDVNKRAQVEELIKRTIDAYGRIDILINNAGFGLQSRVVDLTDENLRAVFQTNVFGCLYTIQAAYPHMKRAGGGQIINVSSIVGLRALPSITGYCMSKFALEALTEGLRVEAKSDNIDVLDICPGSTETEFHGRLVTVGHSFERPSYKKQSAKVVAKAILHASLRKKRRTILTAAGKLMYPVNFFIPGVLDKLLHKAYKSMHKQK